MFLRVLRVAFGCTVIAAVAAPACGGSSSNPSDNANADAGAAGSSNTGRGGDGGKASNSGPVTCGKSTCKAVTIPVSGMNFPIPGCCADENTSTCGLDSSVLASFGPTFPVACQPLAQPGVADTSCPDSAATPVAGTTFTIAFPGCCRANGTCGYQLNSIGGVIQLGLGCVDSSPFVDGGTPAACGDNAGGEGGMGGAGPVSTGDGGVAGSAAGATGS